MASSSQHHPHRHNHQAYPCKHPKLEVSSPPPPPLPLKNPTTSSDTDDKNPNLTSTTATAAAADDDKAVIIPSQEDLYLSNSTYLAYEEVLRRRSHRLKELSKCYKDYYWTLMEEFRVQFRHYMWKYGMSPFKEDEERESAKDVGDGIIEGSGETNSNATDNLLCAFYGCKLKAMALTSFCQLHILSDSKQQLYKPCDYVIKSAQAGPITCGKPILRSSVPSLCHVHLQKAQKHVTRALKKAGLNVSSSSKVAPKFHVMVAEYVREIQGKRKSALRASRNKVVVKQEHNV